MGCSAIPYYETTMAPARLLSTCLSWTGRHSARTGRLQWSALGHSSGETPMTRPLASIGDRFTAQFIDGLAAISIGAGLFYLAKVLGWPLEFAILGWIAYLIFCDAMPRGQSIGKRLIRIAVLHG